MGRGINLATYHEKISVATGDAPTGQSIKFAERPGAIRFRQLENCAAAILTTFPALGSSPIKSLTVKDQAGIRSPAVAAQQEIVKNVFGPAGCRGRQFENRAVSVSAASGSCAIEIAGRIKSEASNRSLPVGTCAKAIQNLLRPLSTRLGRDRQLENCSVPARAARSRS